MVVILMCVWLFCSLLNLGLVYLWAHRPFQITDFLSYVAFGPIFLCCSAGLLFMGLFMLDSGHEATPSKDAEIACSEKLGILKAS